MRDKIGQELSVNDLILIPNTNYRSSEVIFRFGIITRLTEKRIKFKILYSSWSSEKGKHICSSAEQTISPNTCMKISLSNFISGVKHICITQDEESIIDCIVENEDLRRSLHKP